MKTGTRPPTQPYEFPQGSPVSSHLSKTCRYVDWRLHIPPLALNVPGMDSGFHRDPDQDQTLPHDERINKQIKKKRKTNSQVADSMLTCAPFL